MMINCSKVTLIFVFLIFWLPIAFFIGSHLSNSTIYEQEGKFMHIKWNLTYVHISLRNHLQNTYCCSGLIWYLNMYVPMSNNTVCPAVLWLIPVTHVTLLDYVVTLGMAYWYTIQYAGLLRRVNTIKCPIICYDHQYNM